MAFKGTPTLGGNNYAEEKLALDRVDQAFVALRAERIKGAEGQRAKLKDLEAAFKASQDGAGKFVVKNEFGDAIERAGGRGLNASTSWDWTRYFFSLPSNSAELWFFWNPGGSCTPFSANSTRSAMWLWKSGACGPRAARRAGSSRS